LTCLVVVKSQEVFYYGDSIVSTDTPQTPSSNHWPALLFFLAAIGVPGAAAFKFSDTISKNPWQAFAIALLYEITIVALAFLRKVWQQLEDDWSKGTANWVNNLIQKKWFSYHSYYARFLTFQHRDFDIKGLSTQSIYTLELEQVFVDLSIDPKPMHQISSNPMPAQISVASIPEELRMGTHSLWNYLAAKPLQNQQIVILGAPGSGKTTLLKHLALVLVNHKKRRSLSRQIKHTYKLPFLLFLREQAKAIHEKPSFSLAEAIETALARWERPAPEGWARRQLSKGNCLILLDGLDEVGDTSLRKEVVKWVQQQMSMYATNRFVISSRPYGYRSNPLSGIMVLDVRPFTFEQVQIFVNNWYHANEIMSSQKDDSGVRMRAKAGAKDLVRLIRQNPALLSMAVNPLLLTMIATIHRYRSTLPGKRVELYAEICDVFLGKRQQARDITIELSPAQCASVLQPLAYEMMLREHREIATLDACAIIKQPLELVHESMTPEAFLQMIENISGLLLEREQGSYYFAHLTFQEYLAATYISDLGQETILLAHLGESWWEETTRLYSAQVDATKVIDACLNHKTPSIAHLTLAFECLEEALKVQPTIKAQLDRALEQGAKDADPQRRKVIAEVVLRRRLKEMIPVQEGVYRDTSLILNSEYQLFLDKLHTQEQYYQPDHWMDHQFSPAQALLPIVGIRPSSAKAFCRWLTDREQGIWLYRLPNPGEYQVKEVQVCPEWLPPCTWNSPYGYWQEKNSLFEWIRQTAAPVSPLDLDLDLPINNSAATKVMVTEWDSFLNRLTSAHDLASSIAHDFAIVRGFARARDLTIASDLARARDLANSSNFTNVSRDCSIARALVGSCTSALTLATNSIHTLTTSINTLALANTLASTLTNTLANNFAATSTNANTLVSLASALANASVAIFDLDSFESHRTSYILDLARLLALLSICINFSAYALASFVSHASFQSFWKHMFISRKKNAISSLEIQKVLNNGIEISRRLERLEKRRQGKEPACEGILIIKERKQDV
jgi:energy-coupling factor transporter ATP-binding protein EcfA2